MRAAVLAFGFLVLGLFVSTPCRADRMYVANTVLTDLHTILQGKLTPKSTFQNSDVVVFVAVVTWGNLEDGAGTHRVYWNWYKNGTLASTITRRVDFRHAPFRLSTAHPALDFGAGRMRVDVVIDDKVMASVQFKIE